MTNETTTTTEAINADYQTVDEIPARDVRITEEVCQIINTAAEYHSGINTTESDHAAVRTTDDGAAGTISVAHRGRAAYNAAKLLVRAMGGNVLGDDEHRPAGNGVVHFEIEFEDEDDVDDTDVCEECGEEKATVETYHSPATWDSPGVPWAICDDCVEEIRRQNGEQAKAELEAGI